MKTTNYKRGMTLLFFIYLSLIKSFGSSSDYPIEYIKIWGFIKYNTNFQTSRIPDLDSAFQSDISVLMSKGNKLSYNQCVSNLLAYCKSFCENIDQNTRIKNKSLDQLTTTLIARGIRTQFLNTKNLVHLKSLYSNEIAFPTAFVKRLEGEPSLVFTNEKMYLNPDPPQIIRLLALAKYWNIIEYFYPFKELINEDWNKILAKYYIELSNSKGEFGYIRTMTKLICTINDGHSSVKSYSLDKYYGFYSLPFNVSFINNNLIIDEIWNQNENNQFRFGDILLSINDVTFDEYFKMDEKYYWGTNLKRKKNLSARNFLKSRIDTLSTVRILRDDSILTLKSKYINTYYSKGSQLTNNLPNSEFILGDSYLYLNLELLDSTKFANYIRKFPRNYIILDLRRYPDSITSLISEYFTNDSIEFVKYSGPDLNNPGQFNPFTPVFLKPHPNNRAFSYDKIYLMVDYTTISRGEFMCMSFQALPNIETVGDYTTGADGNISTINLPGNITTYFTGLRLIYPDGKPTQGCGIKIDRFFTRTGKGISEGTDEFLEFILNLIKEEGKIK